MSRLPVLYNRCRRKRSERCTRYLEERKCPSTGTCISRPQQHRRWTSFSGIMAQNEADLFWGSAEFAIYDLNVYWRDPLGMRYAVADQQEKGGRERSRTIDVETLGDPPVGGGRRRGGTPEQESLTQSWICASLITADRHIKYSKICRVRRFCACLYYRKAETPDVTSRPPSHPPPNIISLRQIKGVVKTTFR